MQCISAGGDLRNLLLTISYDGKNFHGWQIQNNALTVQEVFQNALKKIIGEEFDIKGCSRTDSGVHANMYCISLKTTHPIAPERLKSALNRWLPLSVAVLECAEVDGDFHARYSCKSKEYIYKIGKRLRVTGAGTSRNNKIFKPLSILRTQRNTCQVKHIKNIRI